MYRLVKRVFDLLVAIVALVLLLPVFIPVMIALKLTGEGEVFYFQKRVGFLNEHFDIWKFATMVKGTEKMPGGLVTVNKDPRITPLGGFLRQTKINELPQFINVLTGKLSLVGPRPLIPKNCFDLYPEEGQKMIYNSIPGITGIGSVIFRDEQDLITEVQNKGGNPMDFYKEVIYPYKASLELWYNENKSFWVDTKILFLTAWAVIFPSSQIAHSAFNELPKRSGQLKGEFDRLSNLKENITLVILLALAIVPLLPASLGFWNDAQFIFLPGFFLVYFGRELITSKASSLRMIPQDIGWFIFITLGFLSYSWAINGSLVWYQAFGWLSLVLWMMLFRVLTLKTAVIPLLAKLFLFLFIIVMFHHSYAIITGLSKSSIEWNSLFGVNANYSSCYLVCLYPFLLFYKSESKVLQILKIISGLFVVYLLNFTSARAAMISMVFVIFYFLWSGQFRKYFKKLIGVGAVALIALFIINNLFNEPYLSVPLIRDFFSGYDVARIWGLKASIWLFTENPIVGIGMGNWASEVYKYNLVDVPPFNYPDMFFYHRNHNLYSQLLSETGIIGFISFMIPVIFIVWKGWMRSQELSAFQKAAFASLLVYLSSSFFYASPNFYTYHFSGIQWLGFCAIGVMSNDHFKTIPISKSRALGLLFLAFLTFGWFVYSAIANNRYYTAKRAIVEAGPEEAVKKFEKLYHPVFKTMHDDRISLSFQIAELYHEMGSIDLADQYYRASVSEAPYNDNYLLAYATFLLRQKKDIEGAKKYVEKIDERHDRKFDLYYLIAEIALAEGHLDKAQEFVEKGILSPNRPTYSKHYKEEMRLTKLIEKARTE